MRNLPTLALLAGGLGTRLGRLTDATPKSMVIVAGEPFIAHQLRLFQRRGIRRVVICAGHLSQHLVAFVGDGRAFGLDVEWSFDGPAPRGTGGALAAALPLLGDRFFVTYGDSWLDIDHASVANTFEAAGCLGLMTVHRNEGRWGASNARYSEGRLWHYSKTLRDPAMQHIDYGLSMLDRAALAHPAGSTFDLADLYTDLVTTGRMAGMEVARRFYEIGSPEGLAETDLFLRESRL